MTEEEYETFFRMGSYTFRELKNPTVEQCLAFLRGFRGDLATHDIAINIPKKHQDFCKTQLKLEGKPIYEHK
ncbi:MAG: hypothetical protein OEZ01_04305 [Candidatus Heimdallarchaeota archaeon]|nr:hypothetical protein [Candidatus Heimdallarchaeota archaeon]